ncbi:hypothetical protein DERF_012007 [Dermatophagoides farinae]|uniref:C2H2-type domain-containing protein n=1 Tax=Dermatophagoides farinae TaxID=6954 RepID=A0A922HRA9_DERFA|nr:hypothetical protein DERF_012007 [Dermatophagoides farinae]
MCKQHISCIHHNELIRCPIPNCGKIYKYPATIYSHMKKKHKDEWPPKTSSSTSSSTPSYSTSSHLKPIKDNNKNYQCPYHGCQNNYTSSKMCKHHISYMHHNEVIRCPVDSCNQIYRYPSNLYRHIRKNHKLECPFLEDDICKLNANFHHIFVIT